MLIKVYFEGQIHIFQFQEGNTLSNLKKQIKKSFKHLQPQFSLKLNKDSSLQFNITSFLSDQDIQTIRKSQAKMIKVEVQLTSAEKQNKEVAIIQKNQRQLNHLQNSFQYLDDDFDKDISVISLHKSEISQKKLITENSEIFQRKSQIKEALPDADDSMFMKSEINNFNLEEQSEQYNNRASLALNKNNKGICQEEIKRQKFFGKQIQEEELDIENICKQFQILQKEQRLQKDKMNGSGWSSAQKQKINRDEIDKKINFLQQEEIMIKPSVQCDSCFVYPIKGVVYKCIVCENYDLCSKCEQQVHNFHPLLQIKNNSQNPKAIQAYFDEEDGFIMQAQHQEEEMQKKQRKNKIRNKKEVEFIDAIYLPEKTVRSKNFIQEIFDR